MVRVTVVVVTPVGVPLDDGDGACGTCRLIPSDYHGPRLAGDEDR